MLQINKNNLLKALVMALELLAMAIILYLLILPFWPALIYKFAEPGQNSKINWQDPAVVQEKTKQIISRLPAAADNLPINRLIIPKLGINAPIIESESDNALNRGSWRLPETSTPNQGGNTVITGHRFKYLPPSNLTFYLLDKLTIGDIISVIWQNHAYLYRVRVTKIVAKTDLSVLAPSPDPILTVFTCHPIYSQDKRLIVIGELLKNQP